MATKKPKKVKPFDRAGVLASLAQRHDDVLDQLDSLEADLDTLLSVNSASPGKESDGSGRPSGGRGGPTC